MSICNVVSSGHKHAIHDPKSKVTFYVQNDLPENLTVIKTDEPAFLTQQERQGGRMSDFLLHSAQLSWMVEIKDNVDDFEDACHQIFEALDVIQDSKHKHLLLNKLIRAFVVSPGVRVPDIQSRKIKNLCVKLRARSNIADKPNNIVDYVKSIRCLNKVNGRPAQDGPTVDNANNFPYKLHSSF